MRKVIDRDKDKGIDIVKITNNKGEVMLYNVEKPANSGNVLGSSDFLSGARQIMYDFGRPEPLCESV